MQAWIGGGRQDGLIDSPTAQGGGLRPDEWQDIRALDREQLNDWIEIARGSEQFIREVRQRLEAFRDGVEPRTCGWVGCSKPLFGRSDANFCFPQHRALDYKDQRAPRFR